VRESSEFEEAKFLRELKYACKGISFTAEELIV